MSSFNPGVSKGLPPKLPLSRLIATASEQIKKELAQRSAAVDDTGSVNHGSESSKTDAVTAAGLLFSGNPHEAVPRRLLLDNRLSPMERNAWQVFRMLIRDDGLTAFPSYEQLQQFLSSQPFKRASRESIAKMLTVLRLCRWLSLCSRIRDEATGQNQGNIYMLHDEPVSFSEAINLDASYLDLVASSVTHANQGVQTIASHELSEHLEELRQGLVKLPTRLQVIVNRLSDQEWVKEGPSNSAEFASRTPASSACASLGSDPESSSCQLSSESTEVLERPCSPRVRNPNAYSTVYTNDSVCKKTVLGPRCSVNHPALSKLSGSELDKAHEALGLLGPEMAEAVLSEWAARISSQAIRKPLGYLLSLVQRALSGEFVIWAGKTQQAPSIPLTARNLSIPAGPATADAGRRGIANIRGLLKPWLTEAGADQPGVADRNS